MMQISHGRAAEAPWTVDQLLRTPSEDLPEDVRRWMSLLENSVIGKRLKWVRRPSFMAEPQAIS